MSPAGDGTLVPEIFPLEVRTAQKHCDGSRLYLDRDV
jgi:hypothetical protein